MEISDKIKLEAVKMFAVTGYARTNNPHLDLIFELGFKAGYNYVNERTKEQSK